MMEDSAVVDASLAGLRDSFRTRRVAGYGLQTLRIYQSVGVSEEVVEGLRREVDLVEWDISGNLAVTLWR